jgi:hypothetical protein
MPLKVGVTGSSRIVTAEQVEALRSLLAALKPSELHHGDCVCADFQAATIATELGIWTVSHPPLKEDKRAFHQSSEILEPKEYLDRDRDIARVCDHLIAMPASFHELVRSGEWATVRYARAYGKAVTIILPDGRIESGN